jgi:signal transduction histidine kinase
MGSSRTKLALVTFLTAVRLPLVLVFFGGAIVHSADDAMDRRPWLFTLSFGALILSALTDAFDGVLARKFKVVSRLGAHADPLMDKFFYLASLPMLVLLAARNGHWMHAVILLVLTLLFLARDQWVTFLRSIGSIYSVSGAADWSGKLRTVINFPLICSVYYYEAAPPWVQWIQPWAIHSFEALGVAITLISLVTYTHRYWPYLKKAAHPTIETDDEMPPTEQPVAAKEECVDLLASSYTHDMNNFLAAIGGNATVMLRHLPEASPLRENATEIKETTDLATSLTADVMKCVGRAELHVGEVRIDALLRDLRPRLEKLASPGTSLVVDPADSVPGVKGDAEQLSIAIVFVVQNAFEAMQEKPGIVTVKAHSTSTSAESGPAVCIEVVDTGKGMSEEILSRAADPFFTTHIRRRGMGLSIAKGIVRAHGGSLSIESRPDRGTTIRMMLPIAKA